VRKLIERHTKLAKQKREKLKEMEKK